MIERWGAFVARRALAVLLAGIAVAVAAGAYGFGIFDHLSQGGFDDAGSESARELQAERDTFGNQNVDVVAIYSSQQLTSSDPEFRAGVEDVVAGLAPGTTTAVIPIRPATARRESSAPSARSSREARVISSYVASRCRSRRVCGASAL